MSEILEDDGTFKALDDQGNEIENSPYDSKKGAKIALNQHKMNTEDEEEESSDLEDETTEEDEEEEDEQSTYSDKTPEPSEESGGFNMKAIIGIGAIATASFLMFSDSSEEQTQTEPEPEPEPQPQDSRANVEEMF